MTNFYWVGWVESISDSNESLSSKTSQLLNAMQNLKPFSFHNMKQRDLENTNTAQKHRQLYNMTQIVLSGDSCSYPNALRLKRAIAKRSDFKVTLDDHLTSTELDDKLDSADLLLVFHFDDSNITAWVIIEDEDECYYDDNDDANSNARSFFPECIDFSDSFTEGLRDFIYILKADFGLSLRSAPRKTRESRRDDMVAMKNRRCFQNDALMLPSFTNASDY
eukprot:scaffold23796_cov181-Cylindrotheca_fusiformis.AAC.5